MMDEAFPLSLSQVTGPIGCDTMSMELLCVIDVSHGIDKNIIKIAFVPFTFFLHKWGKAPSPPAGREAAKARSRPAGSDSREVSDGHLP